MNHMDTDTRPTARVQLAVVARTLRVEHTKTGCDRPIQVCSCWVAKLYRQTDPILLRDGS